MIKQATAADAEILETLLGMPHGTAPVPEKLFDGAAHPQNDIAALRMRAAYRAYGLEHASCRFYLVSDGGGAPLAALCLLGQSALYSGALGDAEELAAFLHFAGVCSFTSESMLLPQWKAVPQLLMRLAPQAAPDVFAVPVEDKPNLWALAHSGLFAGAEPDAWYADACTRVNKGLADIRAVPTAALFGAAAAEQDGPYAAAAGFYCIEDGAVYLNAVATQEKYRGCGCACTLISTLAASYPSSEVSLLCAPPLRRFYEQLGFVLARPVCVFEAPEPACTETPAPVCRHTAPQKDTPQRK